MGNGGSPSVSYETLSPFLRSKIYGRPWLERCQRVLLSLRTLAPSYSPGARSTSRVADRCPSYLRPMYVPHTCHVWHDHRERDYRITPGYLRRCIGDATTEVAAGRERQGERRRRMEESTSYAPLNSNDIKANSLLRAKSRAPAEGEGCPPPSRRHAPRLSSPARRNLRPPAPGCRKQL